MKKYGNFLDLSDEEVIWFLKDLFPNIKKVYNICRERELDYEDMDNILCTAVLQRKAGDYEVYILLTEDSIQFDAYELSEKYSTKWLQYQFAKKKHSLFYKNPYLQPETELKYRSIQETSDEEIIQLIKEYIPFYCVINGVERVKKDDFDVCVSLTCFNAFPFDACTETLTVTDFCILGFSSKNILPPLYCFEIWEKYLLSNGYNQYLKENPYLTEKSEPAGIRELPETKEVSEVCPHCDREVVMTWNVKKDGLKAYCPYCGGRMMLCANCPVTEGYSTDNCGYDMQTNTCKYLRAMLKESCGTVEEIEEMLLNGKIVIDKKEMEQIDSEGKECDALCRLNDQTFPVRLYFSHEKSYERQAAEQIFEQIYQ